MKTKYYLAIIFSTFFLLTNPDPYSKQQNHNESINLGRFTEDSINLILKHTSRINTPEKRIDYISNQFMDIEYQASTLIGDHKNKEILTINLDGLDCFTYLDYVESMRLSESYGDFKQNLIEIRYKEGDVEYQNRNHFFSDWKKFNNKNIVDVTELIGGIKTKKVVKNLNKKEDGTQYLEQIPVSKREISYIPSNSIDEHVLSRLKTGDYIGIYSHKKGLDVSHTGIIVKKGHGVYIRHASSRKYNRRVVDENLVEYMSNKPGLIVFRPR